MLSDWLYVRLLPKYKPLNYKWKSMRLHAVCISWHIGVLGLICENAESGLRCFSRWNGLTTTDRVQPTDTCCFWVCTAEMTNNFRLPDDTITSLPRKKGKIREIGPSSSWILSQQPTCLLCEPVFIHPSSLCQRLCSHLIYDNCLCVCPLFKHRRDLWWVIIYFTLSTERQQTRIKLCLIWQH